jgi:hypothetical protein
VEIKIDDQGNRYIAQDRPGNDKTVIAYIPDQKWAKKDVVSMRIRKANRKLQFGVEVPIDDVPEFVAAIVQLLSERADTRE